MSLELIAGSRARFGPYAIRSGSRRQSKEAGYTLSWGLNPYYQGIKVLDCGDVSHDWVIDQKQVENDIFVYSGSSQPL